VCGLYSPEQIADRTLLDDLAGIHDRHFVAQLGEDASPMKSGKADEGGAPVRR
jgi:hypothetical protein